MLSRSAVFCNWIFPAGIPSGSNTNLNISFKHPCCFPKQSPSFSSSSITNEQRNLKEISPVHYESLRVLEWDKLIDSVASFATTSLGRQATKAQLWSINQSFEESLRLLQETNAAVEMHKHGACRLDFTGIDLLLVKSGLQQARRGLPIDPNEAIAVAAMLEYASVLQLNLKAATKEDADWYTRFLPLSEVIEELVINRSLIRMIQQFIDDDGSVKDSASPALRQARDRVRVLEKRLSQLLDSLIRKEGNETSFPEVSNIDGRWCITTKTEQPTSFRGLLLSSTSGSGKYVEPIAAVPLNDELQQARASVARAEADVLLTLTTKMQEDLIDIEHVLKSLIELDVVTARATYSLSFGGACPDIYKSVDRYESFASETQPEVMKSSEDSSSIKREWKLYMPKAYHPLLLQQYKQNLQKQRTYRKSAIANSARKETLPVPVDFIIDQKTRVLVITGPNTGGKTISLKTVGLAAMMAKTGLHVFSSESVQIPWFDSVFADIGDEQSLSQSLSTFSGHLKQISEILSQSTSQSLVLLDEVGAGTNPLEGAALGMSLLESFAESGALLTMATTHHGELKSLKYSNEAFENACMEFDEVNLKPTFKILWGVPGRSNAINISERLGLPSTVISNARQLYGSDSSEINEVILNMEKFKQEFQELLYEARHYQTLSRKLHERLLITKRNVMEHSIAQRYKKMREISEAAANARSILHKKVRQLRALAIQRYQVSKENKQPPTRRKVHSNTANIIRYQESSRSSASVDTKSESPSAKRKGIPEVGDVVQVSSLGRKATVLRVDQSKGELLVQAGNMKMKLKLTDIRP